MSQYPTPPVDVNPANNNTNDKAPAPDANIAPGGQSSDAVAPGQYLPTKQ